MSATEPAAAPKPLLKRISGNLRLELFLGLGMKAAGAGSAFLFTWLIARAFGADTVGRFQIALSTASILSVWTGLALDNIMIRSVARALQEKRFGDARASFVRALSVVSVTTGLAMLALLIGAEAFAVHLLEAPEVTVFLRLLAPLVLLLGVIRVAAALLRCQGSILVSQSLDGIGYTTFAMLLLGIAWLVGALHNDLIVPVAYVTGVALATLPALFLAFRSMRGWPRGTADIPITAGAVVACIYVAAHFAEWVSLMIVTRNIGTTGAGIYRVSYQVCLLFAVVNTAFNVMMGPHLAAAAGAMDRTKLMKVIRTSSMTGLMICAPLFALILLFAEPILRLFGAEFVEGGMVLRLLATAQLLSVVMGPIGTALMMMHREKIVLGIELAATVLSIVVALMLIPHYGMIGAGIASVVASSIRNFSTLTTIRLVLRKPSAPHG